MSGLPGDAPAVEVVVATRDRPHDLVRLLPSLQVQTVTDHRVLVVDQSDDTAPNAAAVAALGDRRFRHVADPDRGKSRALNRGIATTSAPLVASTDDDCVADPDWLEQLLAAAARHPSAGMVFGDLEAAPHDPATDFVPAISFAAPDVLDDVPDGAPGLLGMGASMLLRRTALDAVGWFDTDLGPGGVLRTGEESELAYRMLRHGIPVVRDPRARVVHHGARPVGDGTASALVVDGFFALGAGYGKHVRTGDGVALRAAAAEVRDAGAALVRAAARRRPPYHVRRTAQLVRGTVAGFRRGPGWPSAGGAGDDRRPGGSPLG